MTIRVSPTEDNPSHHIKLTDSSSTELGLICADAQGNRVSRVSVNPYPAMASQLRQGRGKYADRVPPFEDIPLSDFSGGFAMLHHDEDASKYLEGYRMDTSQPGRVMLSGKETYTTGIRDFSEYKETRAAWLPSSGGATTLTTSFVASAINDTSYEADKIIVWLKKTGSPTGDVSIDLQYATVSIQLETYAAADVSAAAPYEIEIDWSGTETLTHGETYDLAISHTGTSTDYISVFCEFASRSPHFRLLDNTAAYNCLFFEYRGGFYCVTQPEDRSNSKLYQLGTRGLADANTGVLTRLVDSSVNFSSAGFEVTSGDLVKIIAGPGSEEDQPWRVATLGYNGYITVSPAWTVEHTVNTEYVVITDEWWILDELDYYCTDVAVTDRVIHLAGGPDDVHHRIRFGNDDGTWTFQGNIGVNEEADSFYSDKLLAIRHDHHKNERPVFNLYSSSLQENAADLNTPNAVKTLRTPPFWGEPFYLLGTLTDNHAWTGGEYANTDQYSDQGWAAIEWDATFTTGKVAGKACDPLVDMSNAEFVLFAMKSDTALSAGDLELRVLDGIDGKSFAFPAIAGAGDDMHDDWYWYEIPLHTAGAPIAGSDFPDFSKISYLNIVVANDKNAIVKIKIGQDGLLLATRNQNNERHELGLTERVTNMIEYGGGAGQVSRKPWIGTNKNIYYIENNVLKPIYLKEIEELEHFRNCEGMCVNDVYLYFNIGETIQRYYSGHLDNVGPDAEYGLPSDRRGIPCSMATYPGRVLTAIDAGASGTSSVIYRKNHGWHEFYRAPIAGERIKRIHIIGRDDTTDRVYVSEGSDILWVPISLSPENDSDYEFPFFGSLITSRIYAGLRETEKYYHSLTTIQEEYVTFQGDTTYSNLEIDYRTSEVDDWTAASATFTIAPITTNSLSSSNDVSGRWIQFRIRYEGGLNSHSRVLLSVVLDALERLDVNNTYSYTVELKEGTTLDLAEVQETQTGVEKLTQLETWVNSPLPLTLNTCSEFEDGKLVFLEGVRKRVLYHTVDDKEQEVRLADLTLIEVS